MSKPHAVSFLAFLILSAAAFAADSKPAAADSSPPYPEGFLQWTQVKTTTLDPKDPATAKLSSAHFVYADKLALEGLRTGHFPEGAVFVLDILGLAKKDGGVTLGERESTSSMVRDARATATGGWAFGDFDIKTKAALKMDAVTECYKCHTRKADHEYVFTTLKS